MWLLRKKFKFVNYLSATREFFFLKLITVAMNFSKSRNFCAIFFYFHSNNTSVLHNKAFWGIYGHLVDCSFFQFFVFLGQFNIAAEYIFHKKIVIDRNVHVKSKELQCIQFRLQRNVIKTIFIIFNGFYVNIFKNIV